MGEGRLTYVFDDGLGVDFLLDVDGDGWNFQRALILIIFALPDELRIQGWVTRVKDGLGLALVVGDEVAQLFGGDVGAMVSVM
jgi:hypothetical protein